MRPKKVRKIVVDETSFHWAVQERFWPEVYLKVWFEGKKSKPWLVVEFAQVESVTPSIVASIIRQGDKLKEQIKPVENSISNCKYEDEVLSLK